MVRSAEKVAGDGGVGMVIGAAEWRRNGGFSGIVGSQNNGAAEIGVSEQCGQCSSGMCAWCFCERVFRKCA